jgi:hypothetical protein
VNELIHAALPFALRPAGGKACAFSVGEAGTLSLSGEARSDLLIDPSASGPRRGASSECRRAVGLSHAPGTDPRSTPMYASNSKRKSQ